jgi:hypothetical protein
MKKVKAIKFDINLTEPMSHYDINAKANYELEITCHSKSYTIVFTFRHFQGLELREEFFSPQEPYEKEIETLKNSSFYFPIHYLEYKDFKDYLTGYEENQCDENTKLWYFVSMTNYIKLFCNSSPEVKFIEL